MGSTMQEATARVALVTGGRRGIGRGIACALAERGFDVAIADLVRDEAAERALEEVAARGRRARFYVCDVADLDAHAALLAGVRDELGPLDCLVNNAGVSVERRGDLLDATPESFDRLLRINLRGPFFLTQRVGRALLDDPRPGRYRSIINVSSANAYAASVNRGEYCLSKAAITMATKLFAVRLAEGGVAVFEVRPGVIRTDMTQVAAADYDRRIAEGLSPIARWGTPEDVGRAAAALAAGEFPFCTGDAIHVDGGFHIQRL
jgi:NAD(P)-dependent dehydrogenase (short-subunit alcohol dehydrogenase family)